MIDEWLKGPQGVNNLQDPLGDSAPHPLSAQEITGVDGHGPPDPFHQTSRSEFEMKQV